MGHSKSHSGKDLIHKAAWLSIVASVFIFLLKLSAYKITGSAALLSDALESIVNIIASAVAFFVVRYASQPADENHPYGHGKAESFSAAFEGGLIFFAAIMIMGDSLKALLMGEVAQKLEIGLILSGSAALLNLMLGYYLKHVGKTQHSQALVASGEHVLSDVLTTGGVLVGLGLVLVTDLYWLDPVVAFVVGLHLAYTGFKIVRGSLSVLMDEQDESILEHLAQSLEKNRIPGVIDIHHLRIIRSGHFHHVDAHLVVPEFWNVGEVHETVHQFEKKVVQSYPFDGELAFHLDPCKKSYCRACEIENCTLRNEQFKEALPFNVKSLTEGPRTINQETYESTKSSPTN